VSYFKGKKDSYPGSTEKKLATGNKLEGAMENVALAAGGLVIGGRTSQSREGRNVFDTWSENTHEEDLWREGQGESLLKIDAEFVCHDVNFPCSPDLFFG
jgi:hypothetical protein